MPHNKVIIVSQVAVASHGQPSGNDTKTFEEVKKIIFKGIRCDNCKKQGAIKSVSCGHQLCLPCVLKASATKLDLDRYGKLKEEFSKAITWVEDDCQIIQEEDGEEEEEDLEYESDVEYDEEEHGEIEEMEDKKTEEAEKIQYDPESAIKKESLQTDKLNEENNQEIKTVCQCPVNGCEAVIDKEGLDYLDWNSQSQDNQKLLVLYSAADRMKLNEKQDLCTMCKNHDFHIHPASHACIQCRQYLCDECVKLHHSRKVTFKEHAILPSSDGLTHVLMGLCKKHNDIHLYCCLDCYAPLCPSCLVRDTPVESGDEDMDKVSMVESTKELQARNRDFECPHINLHNLNEEDNKWKIDSNQFVTRRTNKIDDKQLTTMRSAIQKDIADLEEQLKVLASWNEDAKKAIDGEIKKLSDLIEKYRRHQEDLQRQYTSTADLITSHLTSLTKQDEELSHLSFAKTVVANSQLAFFYLADTLDERLTQRIPQDKFQVNLQLPKVEPLHVVEGRVRFFKKEDLNIPEGPHKRSSSPKDPERPHKKSPSSKDPDCVSSSGGSGYETIDGRSSHSSHTYESILSNSYASIISSYMKILSTTSSDTYQDLRSRSSMSSLEPKQPTPCSTSLVASSSPSGNSSTPKPELPHLPKLAKSTISKMVRNRPKSIKRCNLLSNRSMKTKIIDIFNEPANRRFVRKISRFHNGTVCY